MFSSKQERSACVFKTFLLEMHLFSSKPATRESRPQTEGENATMKGLQTETEMAMDQRESMGQSLSKTPAKMRLHVIEDTMTFASMELQRA